MKNIFAIALAMMVAVSSFAQTRVINDITTKTTWTTAGSPFILDGYIFVTDTLVIEPGVVIRGMDDDSTNNVFAGGVAIPGGTTTEADITNTEENVGALIVTRTGFLDAQGTAANPIIFTAIKDDLSSSTDLSCADFGLWGGLIMLGNATVSSPAANFNGTFVENTIEGVVTTNPNTALASLYGGNDDNDNRGIIRYISIRHGGDVLSDGDEINGFTLGGVGRGTDIRFVEVIANADDGIEFFGGTVDVKNAVVGCVVDDSYDYDQGFRGRGQFWVTVGLGNRLGEHDGGDNPDTATPESTPVVWNASYVGKNFAAGEQEVIFFRDNAGGNYRNSVFFQSQQGIEIEFRYDITNSFERLSGVTNDPVLGTIQSLNVNNNTFSNIASSTNFFLNEVSNGFTGATNQVRAIANANATIAGLAANTVAGTDNQTIANIYNVSTSGVSAANGGRSYDLRATVIPTNLATPPNDGFFENIGYCGAVDPNAATGAGWMEGWTAVNEYLIID